MAKLKLITRTSFFSGVTWDKKLKGFVLSWGATTEVSNVVFIKMMTISFRWPPVRVFESFMHKEG